MAFPKRVIPHVARKQVADVIAFIAAERAHWVNGAHIRVDGLQQSGIWWNPAQYVRVRGVSVGPIFTGLGLPVVPLENGRSRTLKRFHGPAQLDVERNTEGYFIQDNPVYQRIPNYADSNPVEEIGLQAMSPRVFSREFVHQNRPCVIRGGGKHWPAVTKWASLDYLKDKNGDLEVNVNTRGIKPQTAHNLSAELSRRALEYERSFVSTDKMKFRDFVDKAEHAPAEELPEFFCMYSQSFRPGSPFANLAEDCGSFAFLPRPRNSRLCPYPFRSVFMYRRGITDWHYHPAAEAILTQIRGSKEVVLLPPDNSTWERVVPLLRNEIHICNADLGKYPEFKRVRPVRAHLLPGDCLYIPTHWLHLVATDASHFGMSVPTWWDSPLHIQADIRRKIVRHDIRWAAASRSSLAFKIAYLSLLTGAALSAPLVRLFYGTAAAKG